MMIVASVALSGIYPFAGFFSKDKILEVAFGDGEYVLWGILLLTAGLTAFYSFRLIMMVFFGKDNYHEVVEHPHEAHGFMLLAMSPLFILAMIAGFFEHAYHELASHVLPMHMPGEFDHLLWILIALTTAIAVGGILVAIVVYSRGGFPAGMQNWGIYKLLSNQYYIPKLYDLCIVRPYAAISGVAWRAFDLKVVDFTVDLIARVIYGAGRFSKGMHTGNLSTMLRLMTLGVVILFVLVVILAMLKEGVS